jgi:hypothetical protein
MYSLEGKKKVLSNVCTWIDDDHHKVSQLWQDLQGPIGPLQDHKKIMQALINRFTYLTQRRTEEISSIYHAYPQLINIQYLEGSCCVRDTYVAAKHLTSAHTNATQFDISFKQPLLRCKFHLPVSPHSKTEQTLYTMSEDPRHKSSPHHKCFKRENRFCLPRPNSNCQVKIQVKLLASCVALPKSKIPAQRQPSQH